MNGIKKEIKMGREAILKSVKENKPSLIPLLEIKLETFDDDVNLLETFKEKVALVGGTIKELSPSSTLNSEIKKLYPNSKDIIDCVQEESSLRTITISKNTDPHELKAVDLVIIKGVFGVAENGAIWISEKQFPIRVLPFIANDLVIVLNKKDVCLHLHNAYEMIFNRERSFGLFISGPSKTADIEQCLVIGAQGALSLIVFLI